MTRILPISIATLFTLAALVAVTAQPVQLEWHTLPGEFAIQTFHPLQYYVTASAGGGLANRDAILTAGNGISDYEKFRLAVKFPPDPHGMSIQTWSLRYLTAVDGGGRTSDTLHTDAQQVKAWEQFQLIELSDVPAYYAIQTIHGNYLTAVGGGGHYADSIHTDATQVRAWERFRLMKCGDLGSGYQYTIIPTPWYLGTWPNGPFLYAENGGGLADSGKTDTIMEGTWQGDWSKFKFIRQSDGSYALQTSNGVNYVTALGGGAEVENFNSSDGSITHIFHTDATQVQAWERFKFIEVRDCEYAIQTVSGFYVGIFLDSSGRRLLTTDRSTISDYESFQLFMHGLGSQSELLYPR